MENTLRKTFNNKNFGLKITQNDNLFKNDRLTF